mmetsp:Transcript_21652/g.40463  ORF Transcript_21652/g.40463 Transcript_21652/m.40463 type:complete len:373 (-) Transcript_21652:116-1234(-)
MGVLVRCGESSPSATDEVSARAICVAKQRQAAKMTKDFKTCDELRVVLQEECNVFVEDDFKEGVLVSRLLGVEERQRLAEAAARAKEQKSAILQKAQRKRQRAGREGQGDQRRRTILYKRRNLHRRKQKHRFKGFANWLEEHFGFDEHHHVLDVAGGNGGLCWELTMESEERGGARPKTLTVVDPLGICLSRRKAQILHQETLNPKSSVDEAKDQHNNETIFDPIKLHPRASLDPNAEGGAIARLLANGARQLKLEFDDTFCAHQAEVWETIDLVTGLHPDEATDAIVRNAVKSCKPFAVVPCCVFPTKFPERKLDDVQVRSREQLCAYLATFHPDIKCTVAEEIPGPCNTVVWWRPPKEQDKRIEQLESTK